MSKVFVDIVGSGYQPMQPEAISRARPRVVLRGGTDYTSTL